jgi:hypothetical protein
MKPCVAHQETDAPSHIEDIIKAIDVLERNPLIGLGQPWRLIRQGRRIGRMRRLGLRSRCCLEVRGAE